MSSLVHLYVCIYLNNWTNSACFLCKYQAFFFFAAIMQSSYVNTFLFKGSTQINWPLLSQH